MTDITHPIIRFLRVLRLVTRVASGVFIVSCLFPFCRPARRRLFIQDWARGMLRGFGVELTVMGVPTAHSGWMLVANHISWLDILVLLSICPVHFVSKAEVRHWPVFGYLAARCGTLFIDRSRRLATGTVNAEIAALLAAGEPVAIFPEGTTTDGRSVLPFRTSLLAPAVACAALIQPVAIRYRAADGTPSRSTAFIDDDTLAQSVARMLRLPRVDATVRFAATLPAAGLERRALAAQAQAMVLAELAEMG